MKKERKAGSKALTQEKVSPILLVLKYLIAIRYFSIKLPKKKAKSIQINDINV
jgi:hypothetical protein